MKKKILFTSLLALVSLSLAGCGNDSSVSSSSSSSSSSQTSSSSTPAPSTPSVAEHSFQLRLSGGTSTVTLYSQLTFNGVFDGTLLAPGEQAKVVYSTSTPALVQLDGNVATFVGAGEAVIQGSYTNGGKEYTDSMTITVEENEDVKTIAEARALAENDKYVEVTVQGTITATNGRSAYLQDGTAGIYIYNWYFQEGDTAADENYNWVLGETVEIHSYITAWYDAPQLTASYKQDDGSYYDLPTAYAKKIGAEIQVPTPTTLTEEALSKLTSKDNSGTMYTFEGTYVSGEVKAGATSDAIVTLQIGKKEVDLVFSSRDVQFAALADAWLHSFANVGDRIQVTAPFYNFDDVAQFHMFSSGTSFTNLDEDDLNIVVDAKGVVGRKANLTAYYKDEKIVPGDGVEIEYSVRSSTAGATIENGVVTFTKAGSLTIDATYKKDGKTIDFADLTMTVYDNTPIADITSGDVYYVTEGTIVGKTSRSVLLYDGEAGILLYDSDLLRFDVGTYVSVMGTTDEFNGSIQFSYSTGDLEVEEIDGTAIPNDAQATPLTAEMVNAFDFGSGSPLTAVKKYSWVATAGQDGKYWTLNLPGADLALEPNDLDTKAYPIEVGKNYEVEAYLLNGGKSYVNFVVTKLTPTTKTPSLPESAVAVDHISEIDKDKTMYSFHGEVVAENSKSVLLHDGTAGIMLFGEENAEAYDVGDQVWVVGTTSTYNGMYQVSNAWTQKESGKTYDIPEATELTNETIAGLATESIPTTAMKKYKWSAVAEKSGNFLVLSPEGATIPVEPLYLDEEEYPIVEGRTYALEGYFAGYASKANYVGFVLTSATQTAAPTLSKVTLSANGDTVYIGKTLQLSAQEEPTGAVLDLDWTSSNEAVATVDGNGKVTGVSAGTVTITATSKAVPTVKATIDLKVEPEPNYKEGYKIDFATALADSGNKAYTEGQVGTLTLEGTSGEKNVYWANPNGSNATKYGIDGLKFGKSGEAGSITFNFAEGSDIVGVVFYDYASWYTDAGPIVTVQEASQTILTSDKVTEPLRFTFAKTDSVTITASDESEDFRFMVGSIAFLVL